MQARLSVARRLLLLRLLVLAMLMKQVPQVTTLSRSLWVEELATSYNNDKDTTDKQKPHNDISLIVHLKGELCNHLSILAGARMTQLSLESSQERNYTVHLIGQHQDNPKWTRAERDIKTCFPKLSTLNFGGGEWDEAFQSAKTMQNAMLNPSQQNELLDLQEPRIAQLESILQQYPRTNSSSYSVPYLLATQFRWLEFLRNDTLYLDIREWMEFNNAACCKELPASNEIVFHFRNFVRELSVERASRKKFYDISPEEVLPLFANSSSIAITSRFPQDMPPYVKLLETHGHRARVILGQTGVQDFCFLKQATRGLVGSFNSTFSRWVALLGQAKTAKLYAIHMDASKVGDEPAVYTLPDGRQIIIEPIYRPTPALQAK